MPRKNTPSSVMYAQLKRLGISNKSAAELLLNTSLSFDGHTLTSRIEDSSQLTRRVVHVNPGDIPLGMFNNFQLTCPQLYHRIMAKLIQRSRGDEEAATRELTDALRGEGAESMLEALEECGVDSSMYRNMLAYIDHADLAQPQDRALLLLMLMVVTGCTGRPNTASIIVVEYATNVLGADFHTAQTIINTPPASAQPASDMLLGLVRVIDGSIRRNAQMHVLNPKGTTIGLIPVDRHVVTDVDEDVSRNHARVWRQGGRWLIQDLGSTNGTRVISGADGTQTQVLPAPAEPVELEVTDVVCLGATTRFFVLPIMGA